MAASMGRMALASMVKARLLRPACSSLHNNHEFHHLFSQYHEVLQNQLTRCLSLSASISVKKQGKVEFASKPSKPRQAPDPSNVLVFSPDGALVGKMLIKKAEEMARKDNRKLLDMGMNSDNVQCFKLLTGKEYFEETKAIKAQKNVEKVSQKEIQMTAKITDHDLKIKVSNIRKLLMKEKRVKVTVKGSNRAIDSNINELQSGVLKKITESVQDIAVIKRAAKTSSDLTFVLTPQINIEKEKINDDSPS